MTETSPIGTMGKRSWNWDALTFDEQVDIICRQAVRRSGSNWDRR